MPCFGILNSTFLHLCYVAKTRPQYSVPLYFPPPTPHINKYQSPINVKESWKEGAVEAAPRDNVKSAGLHKWDESNLRAAVSKVLPLAKSRCLRVQSIRVLSTVFSHSFKLRVYQLALFVAYLTTLRDMSKRNEDDVGI
jgi:hypothetical protein